MYRGTTPTITINCDIDVSEFVTMWVTFRTQQLATYAPPKQVEVTKHLGDEGVDATGYILSVILIDSVTKEQVIGDVSFENATASANGKVTVTLAAAPSNPILVIITSIAL